MELRKKDVTDRAKIQMEEMMMKGGKDGVAKGKEQADTKTKSKIE